MNLRWLGGLIAQTRAGGFPPRDLQFVSTEAAHLREDLLKQTLHAAFFTGQLCDPELQRAVVFREPVAAVVSRRHPLASAAPVSLDRLRDEPVLWIRRDVNPLLYDSVMGWCAARGYRPRIVQEVGTLYECLQFAGQGIGITFLPLFMEGRDGSDLAAFVPLAPETMHVDYTLAYCRDSAAPGVERFVKFVQERNRVPSLDTFWRPNCNSTGADPSEPAIDLTTTND
jgi:DNA-binding transcriptional LysR family regulator